MKAYVIEVRNSSGKTELTEAFDGPEMSARERAVELVQKLDAASAHVFEAGDKREVYRIAERF